jgi:hypothetical protein
MGEKGRGEMTEEGGEKGEADQSKSRKVSFCLVSLSNNQQKSRPQKLVTRWTVTVKKEFAVELYLAQKGLGGKETRPNTLADFARHCGSNEWERTPSYCQNNGAYSGLQIILDQRDGIPSQLSQFNGFGVGHKFRPVIVLQVIPVRVVIYVIYHH